MKWSMIYKCAEKKTVALDFDGVLHSYQKGWTGYGPEEDPVDGSQGFVKWLQEEYEVVIFSSRADTESGKKGIRDWLRKHDFPALKIYHEKPPAELYIDDRGFRFTGNFDKVKEFIKSGLSPWYEDSQTT